MADWRQRDEQFMKENPEYTVSNPTKTRGETDRRVGKERFTEGYPSGILVGKSTKTLAFSDF